MPIEISGNTRSVGDPLPRSVAMPAITGATARSTPVVDRVGGAVNAMWPVASIGGIAGGVAGARGLKSLLGGMRGAGLLGAIGGALLGAGTIIGATALLGGNTDRSQAPSLTAKPANSRVSTSEDVRVMTFNLHGGMGGKGEFLTSSRELDRIADAIEQQQPDIVILQEADHNAPRSNRTDTIAELSRRLGPTSAVGAATGTRITGREQEVAVMTFNGFSVENARNLIHEDPRGSGVVARARMQFGNVIAKFDRLIPGSQNPVANHAIRNSIDAIVQSPAGTHIRVIGGHYEWPTREVDHQERQVGAIADAVSEWQGPTIFGADFNVSSATAHGKSERKIMANAGLRDAFIAAGITVGHRDRETVESGSDLDRIYASDHFSTSKVAVSDTGWVSDHLPVVADFTLNRD